jgi:hypothetical protein
MRHAFAILVLALSAAVAARAQDDVQKLVDKALKAHGGAEQLAKFKAFQMSFKGVRDIQGNMVPFTQEVSFQFPDKLKEQTEFEFMGQKIVSSTVMNGDQVTVTARGQDKPVTDELKKELRESLHVVRLRMCLALKDKNLELAPLGDSQVNGKPALGLKISAKGYRDLNLFFDKDTGLVVRSERQVPDAQTGQEVKEARTALEFQDVQGIKLAKKMLVERDGQKLLEVEITQAKLLEKLDDAIFKP